MSAVAGMSVMPRSTGALLAIVAAKVTVILAVSWYNHHRSHCTTTTTTNHRSRRKQEDGDEDDNEDEYRALLDQVPPKSMREFEQAALHKMGALAKVYFQYYSEVPSVTMTAGRTFLDSIRLLPTILTGDLTQIDTRLTLLDQTLELPVLIAPSAFHVLATPEGEIATARGAGAAGAGYCYNWMLSSKRYDHVLNEPGVKWLHLYMYEERDLVKASIETAEATGTFTAVILTCDHPHTRVQNRMVPYFTKAQFPHTFLDDPFLPNQAAMGFDQTTWRALTSMSSENHKTQEQEESDQDDDDELSPSAPGGTNSSKLSWEDVKWIQSLTKLPIVVKGILSASDAEKAIELGVHAIVVSNHGGRQCDFAPSAMEALPAVVAAVQKRIPVLVDSGIRSSTDVLKALCLGASGVLLGRPPLWALSCEGSAGLERMLQTLKLDLQSDMRSLGVSSMQQLSMAHLWPPDRERIKTLVQLCNQQ